MKEYTKPVLTTCYEIASNPQNVVELMGVKSYVGCSGTTSYACNPIYCK